jgi:hypothetical protein
MPIEGNLIGHGLLCVEVDLELLRGEREPELTLFG